MIYTKESGVQNVNTGAIELVPDTVAAQVASWHQVAIQSSATAGQWNVEFMYAGMMAYIAAAPISAITATGADAYKPLVLDRARIKRVRLTPSGVTAGTTYTATLTGGD